MAYKGFTKGHAKVGGRKLGVPNKTTVAIKDMITTALSNKGGVKYLERQADENPVAFMGLVGKVLPLQVNHANSKGEELQGFKVVLVNSDDLKNLKPR